MNTRFALTLALPLSLVGWDADAHRIHRHTQPLTGPVDHSAERILDEHTDVFVARIGTLSRNGRDLNALTLDSVRRFKGSSNETEHFAPVGDGGRCHIKHLHSAGDSTAPLLDASPPDWSNTGFLEEGNFVIVFRREGACAMTYVEKDPGNFDEWSTTWNQTHGHFHALYTRMRARSCQGAPSATSTPTPDTDLIVYGSVLGQLASGFAILNVETAFVPDDRRDDLTKAFPNGTRLTLNTSDDVLGDLKGAHVIVRARRSTTSDGADYVASFCGDVQVSMNRPLAPSGFITLPKHKLSCGSLSSLYDSTQDHVALVVGIEHKHSRASLFNPVIGLRATVLDVLHGDLPESTKEVTLYNIDSTTGSTSDFYFDSEGTALVVGKQVVQDPEYDLPGQTIVEVERCGPSRSLHTTEVPNTLGALLAQDRVFRCPAPLTDDASPQRADVIGFGELVAIDRSSVPHVATFSLDHFYAGAHLTERGIVRVNVPNAYVDFAFGVGTLLSLKKTPKGTFDLTSCGDQRLLMVPPARFAGFTRHTLADAPKPAAKTSSCTTTQGAPIPPSVWLIVPLIALLRRRARARSLPSRE